MGARKLIKIFVFFIFLFISSFVSSKEYHYVRVEVIFIDSLKEIPLQHYKTNGTPVLAGIFKKEGSVCKIWLEKPKNFDDLEKINTLGHEMFHCITGKLHTKEYINKHYRE